MGVRHTMGDQQPKSGLGFARLWAGLLLAPLLVAVAVACGGGGEEEPRKVSRFERATPPAMLTREARTATGYPNPDLLIHPEALAPLMFDKDVILLDARKKEDYEESYIDTAISLPVELTFAKEGPKNLLAPVEELEKVFGEHGVGNDTRVFIYDSGVDTRAARLLWTLEYLGHDKVAVVDGGYPNMIAFGFRATGQPNPFGFKPKSFKAKVNPGVLTDKDQITADLGKEGVVFLDARSPAEYNGEDVRAKRGGHIPGAVNIDWRKNFTDDDIPLFLPAEELKKLYADAGVTSDKKVHAY